ncbi:putative quiescin sulfhydryl oxidase, partial [Trypanosoma theileri]
IDLAGTMWHSVHHSATMCPWVVLFYNDGCGHCRSTARKKNSFATRMEDCYEEEDPLRMATVAAINCAVEISTCRDNRILTVPKLVLFVPPNCSNKAGVVCDADMMQFIPLDHSNDGFSRLRQETRRLIKQTMHFDGASIERCVQMRHALYDAKSDWIKRGSSSLSQFVETTKLYPTDIAGAFFSTLLNEVPLVGLNPPDRLQALKDFLRLVEHALPGLEAASVLDVVRNFESGEEFSVPRWQSAVIAAHIPFEGKPRAVQWRTCSGSSSEYRGFPCAMWLLYHSLTANADKEANPLEIIQNYVRYFFSCEHCREHFLQFDFKLDDDPLLQLWRAHNNVNARLAIENTSNDPLVPKQQFPTRTMCPECYNSLGTFDEQAVVKFLQRRYEWDPDAVSWKIGDGGGGGGVDAGESPNIISKGTLVPPTDVHKENEEVVRRDPIPIHVFLTGFVIVTAVGAGILRIRGKYISSHTSHRHRMRV